MRSVLVIAAHPDDEILGCGGTISSHVESGDEVNVILVSEGITSRSQKRNREIDSVELNDLIISAQKANKILGVKNLDFLNYPDNRLDSIERLEIIKSIEEKVAKYHPEVIYTHHSSDLNIDHRIVYESVVTASRPIPNQCIKTILSFEVASSTEWQPSGLFESFNPNWFVNISNHLNKKLRALEEYSSEMRDWPHARSLEAIQYQSKYRGSQIGVEAAEAFKLLRMIK